TCKAGYSNTGSAVNAVCEVTIPANAKWSQNGVTIAGGHGEGGATNQFVYPYGLFVDD
ncbi:unnamed protein product, partial [Rotaria magnacalcarata]